LQKAHRVGKRKTRALANGIEPPTKTIGKERMKGGGNFQLRVFNKTCSRGKTNSQHVLYYVKFNITWGIFQKLTRTLLGRKKECR